MKIEKTECITFPRSGHHCLMRVLAEYFGPELRYAEIYESPELNFDVCPATNVQKNHDFGLDTKIEADRRYVVQIRDPVEAIQSWAELEQTPRENGITYFAQKLDFYSKFVQKWVLGDVPNRLTIHYRDLLDYPYTTVSKVIRHILGDEVDTKRLEVALRRRPVVPYFGTRPGNWYLS